MIDFLAHCTYFYHISTKFSTIFNNFLNNLDQFSPIYRYFSWFMINFLHSSTVFIKLQSNFWRLTFFFHKFLVNFHPVFKISSFFLINFYVCAFHLFWSLQLYIADLCLHSHRIHSQFFFLFLILHLLSTIYTSYFIPTKQSYEMLSQ